MRFITLITVAISVLAFASQSASALPVQDSHQRSNGLSKRLTDAGSVDNGNGAADNGNVATENGNGASDTGNGAADTN
jgi:hypothetical protein